MSVDALTDHHRRCQFIRCARRWTFAGFAWMLRRMDERFNKVDEKFDKAYDMFDRVHDELHHVRTQPTEAKISMARREGPPPRRILSR